MYRDNYRCGGRCGGNSNAVTVRCGIYTGGILANLCAGCAEEADEWAGRNLPDRISTPAQAAALEALSGALVQRRGDPAR